MGILSNLFGCTPFMRTSKTSDHDKEMLEILLTSLNMQDADAITALYSPAVLAADNNIDDGILYLYQMFVGTVTETDRTGVNESKSVDVGSVIEIVDSNFTVTTDANEYRFFFKWCSRNDPNPEEIGLIKLQVILASEEYSESNRSYFEDENVVPGIYVPS